MGTKKPVHTLILDSGPIIKNEPTISTLIGQSEAICTPPSVLSEIRDVNARSRVETTLLPFLTVRDPRPDSLKTVVEFARKTGDYEVLSRTDCQVLALAYELECERNGGDWRLRRVPGQKRVNGAPPKSKEVSSEQESNIAGLAPEESEISSSPKSEAATPGDSTQDANGSEVLEELVQAMHLNEKPLAESEEGGFIDESSQLVTAEETTVSEELDSDSDGWITPSNIKKHQAKEEFSTSEPAQEQKVMQVATMTTDFAMQNVLLQMNLNLISPSLKRVRHLKTFILRCHACFERTKDMSRQFCPRCGKPTLMRVSCSTLDNGEFRIHLKKNMQWNHRGNRFSVPKPVSGSASGKVNVGGGGKGGGKGGWGHGLILAPDQKEYERALKGESSVKERSLLDEDYLPGILTGERGRAGGRPKIGAGRNVNSRKRK